MKNSSIRLTIILGIISIVGIFVFQIYILQRNFNYKERHLNQSIQIALREVAEILSEYNQTPLPYENVVYQYSRDYYVVNVNGAIDATLLEHYLIKEFSKRNIQLDFEYGIYDCYTDKMVYGNYIDNSGKKEEIKTNRILPTYDEYLYYFGIYFPDKHISLLQDMGIFYFLTIVLAIVILFFGYTQLIILRQKQLSETQKSFINNLTHEFKTPLSSLKLSTEVLQDNTILKEPERFNSYIKILNNQTQILIDHVDSVLQITKEDENRSILKKEKVNIHNIIRKVKHSFDEKINRSKGIFNLQLESSDPVIFADEFQFQNLLFNLIDNGIKYSTANPEITIKTMNIKNGICIKIADNGEGMERKYLKKIFHKFFRIPTGNVHNVKGFGLGLALVKKIVKEHGWKISVKSERGKGTVFIVCIKREKTGKD